MTLLTKPAAIIVDMDGTLSNFEAIYMRADGDFRQDYVIKEEILDRDILPNYSPQMAFDDRNRVVEMWRRRGIPCLQVASGDF
jgi:beta-phosphoglucomutase-like phosphatase (HAD superfamily)